MTKLIKKIDNRNQLNIFELIEQIEMKRRQAEPVSKAGKYDWDKRLRSLISEALKASPYSRYEVAARMSELLGKSISKEQMDSWSAESKENHRFPLVYLPAFTVSTGDSRIMRELAELCNGHFIESEDALRLELGRIEEAKRELVKKERTIKGFLDGQKRRS